MKAEMEKGQGENRGIDVISETEDERQRLESLWTGRAAVLVFTRSGNSVTLTIGPAEKSGGQDEG